MQSMIRNTEFAAKLALTYAEMYDGISPNQQRVSLRITGEGRHAILELKNAETHGVVSWSIAEMRQVADQARDDALIFAPNDTDPARLVIREVDAMRAILGAAPHMKILSGPRGLWRKVLLMGGLAAASIAAILFVFVPFMADRGAEMIPPDAEVAMGNTAFNQIYRASGVRECDTPQGRQALQTMEARLLGDERLPYPLTVRVVDDPMPQATALPGGQITLYRGLIESAATPEEVAAVFAHEIGHVAHRDGTRSTLRAMGSFGLVGLAFGDVLGGSVVAGVTQAVISSSHSREAEERADAYSHRMLERAGVSPASLGIFFRRLQEQGYDIEMGVFQHLSTHPELLDRIAAAEAAALHDTEAGTPILSEEEWLALRGICSGTALPPGAVVAPGAAAGGSKG